MAKRVLILVERYFQDMEALYPYYRLKEAGFEVKVAGTGEKSYAGKHGYPIDTDGSIEDLKPEDFDCVVVPGGWAPDYMRRNRKMVEFVRALDKEGKVVAAICHGGWMLASAGICRGRKVTSFFAIKDDMANAGAEWSDAEVVVDGNLITSRKPDDLPAFCREIVKALG